MRVGSSRSAPRRESRLAILALGFLQALAAVVSPSRLPAILMQVVNLLVDTVDITAHDMSAALLAKAKMASGSL